MTERSEGLEVPFRAVTEWTDRFPWLFAGITHSGSLDDPFDLRRFGDAPPRRAVKRWRNLLRLSGFESVIYARQIHGTTVLVHDADTAPDAGPDAGVCEVDEPADGHATSTAGLLLAITVADCVPVYVVDAEKRSVAILHAGWRGTAAGILAVGISEPRERCQSEPDHLWVHLGPAICGACYEVGPEVFEALGQPAPPGPAPVDVRAALVSQAQAAGVRADQISVSKDCTLCGESGFFSHRGGRPERQAAVLGVRP
jgi:YfiH family protein